MTDGHTAERRQRRIEHYYGNKIAGAEVLIDNVWDEHNVAAILRSADGFGIPMVNLYYTYNEFPDLARWGRNAGASAIKWVERHNVDDLDNFAREKKANGHRFIAADAGEGAHNLPDYAFPERCMIVLGGEMSGVAPEVREICDDVVAIPMVGMVASYNVSVAAAVMFYELFRQKGGDLDLRDPNQKGRE